jgi:hypothetical protein
MKIILPSSKSRTEAFPSKTRALTPVQRRALLHLLNVEKATYATTSAKLKKQFGISLSITAISRFWHRHCGPPLQLPDVLLDVVIQSDSPVRLTIKRKDGAVKITKLEAGKACQNLKCKPPHTPILRPPKERP